MEKLTSNLIITFYIITLKVDSSLWLFSILRKKFSSAKKGRKRWTMSRYRRTIKVGQIRLNLRVLKNYSAEILVSGFCRYKQNRGVSIYRRFSSFLYLNKFVLLRNWQLRLDLSRINLGSVQYYNARLLSFFHGSCKMKLQILTFGEYWNRFLKQIFRQFQN